MNTIDEKVLLKEYTREWHFLVDLQNELISNNVDCYIIARIDEQLQRIKEIVGEITLENIWNEIR